MWPRVLLLNTRQQFTTGNRLWCSKPKKLTTKVLNERPNPNAVQNDYIGPPDKESNLRPYVRFIPHDETPLAARLRQEREQVDEWNQEFWSRHNKRFYDEREEFIRMHKAAGLDEISADRMSVFYKSFLDKNRRLHVLYNVSWYIKNFNLLVLALQVQLQKLWPRKKVKNAEKH